MTKTNRDNNIEMGYRGSRLEDIAASVAPSIIMMGGATSYIAESLKEGDLLHVANGILGTLSILGLSYIVYRHRRSYNPE